MALHNYIYSKHQHDVNTDNKIAKEHEPRPDILDHTDSTTTYVHQNQSDDELKHKHEYENEHNNKHKTQNNQDHQDQYYNIQHQKHDLKGTYANELLIEEDEDDDELMLDDDNCHELEDVETETSSDSDFLRHKQTHRHHIHHHSNHSHLIIPTEKHHNSVNEVLVESINSFSENPKFNHLPSSISDFDADSSNSQQKVQFKESKWVVINGKKKKLKSRFASRNSLSISSVNSTNDKPLLILKHNSNNKHNKNNDDRHDHIHHIHHRHENDNNYN